MAEKDAKEKSFFAEFGDLVRKHYGAKPEEKKFAEAKAKDGSVLTYEGDMPMEGMPVFVVTPDGGQAPVPDGVVMMEDGSQIEVLAGKIVKVKPADAPQEETKPAEQMQGKETLAEAAAKRIVESVVKETHYSKTEVDAKIAELKTEFAAIKTAADEAKAEAAAVKAENATLTAEVAGFKAQAQTLTEKFSKHETFAAEVQKLLVEPQEQKVPKPEVPDGQAKVPSRAEWQKRFMK